MASQVPLNNSNPVSTDVDAGFRGTCDGFGELADRPLGIRPTVLRELGTTGSTPLASCERSATEMLDRVRLPVCLITADAAYQAARISSPSIYWKDGRICWSGTSIFCAKRCERLARCAHSTSMPALCCRTTCTASGRTAGDDDFSNRWKAIKIRFVQGIPYTEGRSRVRVERGERGSWQLRFREHAIRDERDYDRHLDYVHYNPVKHGWVKAVREWPHSTFHRWVQSGAYPSDWAGGSDEMLDAGERS